MRPEHRNSQAARRAKTMHHAQLLGVLSVALIEDAELLRVLVTNLSPDARRELYRAGQRMLNALAAKDAELRRVAPQDRMLSDEDLCHE